MVGCKGNPSYGFLFSPAVRMRARLAAWRDAGVTTPIVVPSSAAGNQLKAIAEAFAAFA